MLGASIPIPWQWSWRGQHRCQETFWAPLACPECRRPPTRYSKNLHQWKNCLQPDAYEIPKPCMGKPRWRVATFTSCKYLQCSCTHFQISNNFKFEVTRWEDAFPLGNASSHLQTTRNMVIPILPIFILSKRNIPSFWVLFNYIIASFTLPQSPLQHSSKIADKLKCNRPQALVQTYHSSLV